MSISNVNPQQRDVVIYQRDDTNSYWGEAHISGSNLIFYIDAQGHINADTSASFYSLFPASGSGGGGSGTTLVTGGLYPITASWAISASWAPSQGSGGTTLVTGGLYPITASWSQTSSWALNVINAINSIFASSSVSSSFINVLSTASNANFYIPFVISNSFQQVYIDPNSIYYNPGTDTLQVNNISSSIISASVLFYGTASWAQNAINGGTTLVTASTIPITASVALVALTASYVTSSNVFGTVGNATRAGTADTASFVTSSNVFGTVGNAAHAGTSDTASYITSSGVFGTVGNATNAGFANQAVQATSSLSASYITASNIVGIVPTASVALNANSASVAVTASFALNFNPSATASFATQASTASLAQTASSINFLMNNDASSFYIPFVATGSNGIFSGSGQVMYVDTSSIIYNPGTNTLTVNNLSASTITASLFGTASNANLTATASLANTSSYALTSSFMNASVIFISSSIQNNNYTYWTAISGSGQTFTLATASNLVDSGSFAVLTGTASWAINAANASLPANAYFNSVTSSAYAISQSVFTSQVNNYTISSSDDGRLVVVNSGSLLTITVTTSSISPAFSSMYYQSGSGRFTFVTASTSVFLRNRSNFSSSAGQYALVSLLRVPNGDFVLGGDLA